MNEPIPIGVYREKDYKKILELCADRGQMPETWKKWRKTKEKAVKNLAKYGIETVDVLVLPQDLKKYCKKNNLRINKTARSAYITSKKSVN